MSIGLPPTLNGALGCCVNNYCGGQGGGPTGPGSCSPSGSNCGQNGITIVPCTVYEFPLAYFDFPGSSGNSCSGGGQCGGGGSGSGGVGIQLFSMGMQPLSTATCGCTPGSGGQNNAGGNGPAGFCNTSSGNDIPLQWYPFFQSTNSMVARSLAVCPPAL